MLPSNCCLFSHNMVFFLFHIPLPILEWNDHIYIKNIAKGPHSWPTALFLPHLLWGLTLFVCYIRACQESDSSPPRPLLNWFHLVMSARFWLSIYSVLEEAWYFWTHINNRLFWMSGSEISKVPDLTWDRVNVGSKQFYWWWLKCCCG